jgi:hypothetical protein
MADETISLTREQITRLMGERGPRYSYDLVDRGLVLLASEILDAAGIVDHAPGLVEVVYQQLWEDLSDSLARLRVRTHVRIAR